MRLVATIAITLVKLAFAFTILCVGWMVFSPTTTGGWPFTHAVSPVIERVSTAFPLERGWWGVLVLALGAGSFLAALPKKTVARSSRRTPTPLSPEVQDAHEPVAVVDPVHQAPVMTDAAAVEAAVAVSELSPETAALSAPWDFPAPVMTVQSAPVVVGAISRAEVEAPDPSSAPDFSLPADPLASHEAALAEARATLMQHPGAATRSRLADLLKKSGDIEEAEGRLGPAIDAYEQSVALRREVVAEQPDNAREARWLWMTLETLAECRDDRGHHTQAAALYREGLAAGERAIALAPHEPRYLDDIADTRARLAALEVQTA